MLNAELTALKPFGVLVQGGAPGRSAHELPIPALRELFRREHLVVLRGFAPFETAEGFADYCARFGEISLWPFGKVLELIEQENPEDHIFDHRYVPLHWDGMYRPQVPEYQIFHCVKAPAPGQGGRTTFSNTRLALEHAAPEIRALWSRVTGDYRRKMEFYDSRTVSPVVTRHPFGGHEVIRYNEPPSPAQGAFINPPDQRFTGATADELQVFHRSLQDALYSPAAFYAHEWQAGDVVLADNFTLLHGREGFVSRSPRHIRRVHVLSDPPLDNPALVSHK